jgi:hypothetical protein
METPAPSTATSAGLRRWPLFSLGVLLFALGPVGYFVMFQMKYMATPWHAPILATLGLVFVAMSLARRPRGWRIAGIVPFVLLCGLEWFFVLVATKTPEYTGPAKPSEKLPAFETTLADGKLFSDKDLATGVPTTLVFFRGRW